MADRRQTKSKYTADRGIPGAFEGETVTRRRFMTGTRPRSPAPIATAAIVAAGARLRARPDVREARRSRGRPSARSTSSPTTPTSRRSSRSSPASARPARATVVRAQAQPADRHRAAGPVQPVRRDLDALHAPRLPRPLRRGRRAASSARATAASTTSAAGRRRAAGAPARPLLHARRATARSRSARATASTASSSRFSPRDPGEPLDGIGQYLYPSRSSVRKLPGT